MIDTLCFVDAAALDDLAPGAVKSVLLRGERVALANVDGQVYALGDLCLRCGSMLGLGHVRGRVLCCRGCDWRYDLADGRLVGLPMLRAPTFEVQIQAGRILVALHPAHPHAPLDG